MDGRVFYVGTDLEVAHHAGPLAAHVDLQIAPPEEVLSAARPGDVAVFYSEHFDRFRSLCVNLKRQNVATLYAIDGILEWRNAWANRPDELACPWTMRPCLSHVVASIGPRQAAVLEAWGNPQVVPVGLPRLDALCRNGSRTWPAPDFSGAASGSQSLPRDGERIFRVLVLTAKCPGFTAEQIETTLQSLRALQSVVRHEPRMSDCRIELVWRLTGGLEQRLGVTNSGMADPSGLATQDLAPQDLAPQDLATVIGGCDAVITTPSTAMLEGMLCQRPVAILDFHNTPVYADAVFRISAADQIGPVIRQLIQFQTSPALQQHQAFLLQENLWADGQATARLADLLGWMQVQSRAAADRGQAWVFDRAAWWQTRVPEEREGFEIFWNLRQRRILAADERCAPGTMPTEDGGADPTRRVGAELAASALSLPQWQAYTEQLERENRRLERLVRDAHQVFDHMQRHPVLGTLLKSHEWWSRWWRGSRGALAQPESWEES
jgi:hypothetical protein